MDWEDEVLDEVAKSVLSVLFAIVAATVIRKSPEMNQVKPLVPFGTGAPHPTQTFAVVLTSFPHSAQGFKAILGSLVGIMACRIAL